MSLKLIIMNLKQTKTLLGAVLLIMGMAFATNLYIESKEEKLKTEINNEIETILQGRKILMDGQFNDNIFVSKDKVPNDGFTPQYEGIKRYYKLVNGGFSFYVLENTLPGEYDVYNLTSTDLAYKSEFSSLIGHEYPSFKDCYKDAYEFFIQKHPKYLNAYVPGSTNIILKIGELKNQYYQIARLDKASLGFQTIGHPCVSTSYYNLFYNIVGQKYGIEKIPYAVVWDYIIYMSIEMIILGILAFIFLYKPKAKDNKVDPVE